MMCHQNMKSTTLAYVLKRITEAGKKSHTRMMQAFQKNLTYDQRDKSVKEKQVAHDNDNLMLPPSKTLKKKT